MEKIAKKNICFCCPNRVYLLHIIKEEQKMEDHIEEPEKRNSLLQVALAGIFLIVVASIAKLIAGWVNFPGSITSVGEFFKAVLDSFIFVLNFDFKVWWVFLLVLYLVARWGKKKD